MSIALSCESTCDLSNELKQQFQISTVPFSITLGEETISDDENASKQIFNFFNSTGELPKTSAVNINEYKQHFSTLLADNDYVLHISLSSKLSSSYNNACAASKEFDGRVYVVDSLSLSTGIALLALQARKMIDGGLSASEIQNKLETTRQNLQVSFVACKLNFLHKGGRCNTLQYLGANLLKIKPEITVTDGEMGVSKKFIGLLNNVSKNYVNDILEKHPAPDYENVFITYSTFNEKDLDLIKERLKAQGFKNVYVTKAGGTISSHCGPECMGVLFLDRSQN